MKLSEKIYALRKRLGMSQEDLASALHVSRQSISNWETGAANPEIGKLSLLAETLGVSVDFLLDEDTDLDELDKGSMSGTNPIPISKSSPNSKASPNSEAAPYSKVASDSNAAYDSKSAPYSNAAYNSNAASDSKAGTKSSAESIADTSPKSSSEHASEKPGKPSDNNYPDWLDGLPKFLQTGIYRYGWLYGVRIAISGLVFIIFGIIARTVTGGFMRDTAFMGLGDTVTITPDDLPPDVINQIHGQMGYKPPGSSFMYIIPNAALIIGVVVMIIGIILAIVLKQWGDKQQHN